MGEQSPRDRSLDPGELLRSALEKIVYFECRLAQLEAELSAARQVAERARADAGEARAREAQAATALAAEREARANLSLRDAELSERVTLLEAERERLMAGLVERARVAGAPVVPGQAGPDEDAADLAGFIAELRGELETLRAWKSDHEAGLPRLAEPRPRPAGMAAGATVDGWAGAFAADGRTGLGGGDVRRLQALLPTNADRVLHERAMGDLSDAAPEQRLSAIRRLAALGSRASTPLLAVALGREPDATVKVTLLRTLAGFGEPFAAALAAEQLGDPRAEVRAAALEALATVAEADALPRLLAALDDRSPVVRRRATVLLNGARDERAEEGLLSALRDADQGVARAAAVALSGRTSERARRAVARHGHLAGGAQKAPPVPPLAPVQPHPAGYPAGGASEAPPVPPLSSGQPHPAAPAFAASPSPAALRIAARLSEVAPVAATTTTSRSPAPAAASVSTPTTSQAATVAARRVAVLEAPAAAAAGDGLISAIALELRGALRGRTAEELGLATGAPAARVEAALEILRQRGAAVARGPRWCVA